VLVVVGLMALLLQLLLPAVQAAREAARRHQCAAHLRQLGLAATLHHDALGYFPSGGWHYTWIGEPERGSGPDQPGGWPFALLAYLEHSQLRDAGRGQAGDDRSRALAARCQTALPEFHCPSRREARVYPQRWNRLPFTRDGQFTQPLDWVAKTDYAANVGTSADTEFRPSWPGPRTLAEGDDPEFVWPDLAKFNGVVFGRSRTRHKHVRDGLAKTYLIAEKYVDASHYETGEDWGDNENLFTGFNNDNCRSALSGPQRDRAGADYRNSFGSAHTSVWQAVFCDGSLRILRFDLDRELHRQLARRADNQPSGPTKGHQ
jgi:hypothetical protein